MSLVLRRLLLISPYLLLFLTVILSSPYNSSFYLHFPNLFLSFAHFIPHFPSLSTFLFASLSFLIFSFFIPFLPFSLCSILFNFRLFFFRSFSLAHNQTNSLLYLSQPPFSALSVAFSTSTYFNSPSSSPPLTFSLSTDLLIKILL